MFAKKVNLPTSPSEWNELELTLNLLLVTSGEKVKELEFLEVSDPGVHWLPLLDQEYRQNRITKNTSQPKALHFYGFKGGQARSTVLAMLARQLADDGYRVLAIDADIEAPSLHVLLNTTATTTSQTLLGLVHSNVQPHPLAAYRTRVGGGCIDLLPCRPSGSDFDMDFAAFALRTALDVTLLEKAVQRMLVTQFQRPDNEKYDVVLYDHRSGLASSVLPMMQAHPGPAVVCLRIDDQSLGAVPLIEVLFSQRSDLPGAFVNFSLDPDENREKTLRKYEDKIGKYLESLGAALLRGADPEYDAFSPEELSRYWISWYHDRAFFADQFPKLTEIAETNRQSLLQLREVLDLSGKALPTVDRTIGDDTIHPRLSTSGAIDQGNFIEPSEFSRLFESNTSISYIFGRKGTGKTRLLRELRERNLGEPLLVAADRQQPGELASSSALFNDLAQIYVDNAENLWWELLDAALSSKNTTDESFQATLSKRITSSDIRRPNLSAIAHKASNLKSPRAFLIDGVETAFTAGRISRFVEGLFRFILVVQSDPLFSEKISIRLFLRTDLARNAIQNVEQQTAGRTLDILWNAQSIFNFVLSRIGQIDWFKTNFPSTVAQIQQQSDRIRLGDLQEEEYERLLLEIFPKRLRRNNLQTLTFLKTYFSDAAGDDEARAAFYPRLFVSFLTLIANPEELPKAKGPLTAIEDGRVNQALVLAAHDEASKRYLSEVEQELSFLLELVPDKDQNVVKVRQLLEAFNGLPTPFNVERCIETLASRLNITDSHIRESLIRMKDIGMFEERPRYPGDWRVGRLFKSALNMKYVRS